MIQKISYLKANKQTNKQTKSQQKLEHWKKKQQTSVFPISLIHSSTFSPHVTSAKVCLHSISAMFEAVSKQFLIFCTIIRFLYCLNYTDSAIIFTIATGNFVTCIRGNFVGLNIFDPTDFNCWLQSWPFNKIGI